MDSITLGYYCPKGHKVESTYYKASYYCAVCSSHVYATKPGYDIHSNSCKMCDHDVCTNCYQKAADYIESLKAAMRLKGERIASQKLLCQFDHPFQFSSSMPDYKCTICAKKPKQSYGFFCEKNCMTVCLDCAEVLLDSQLKRNQSKDINKNLRCDADHPLIRVFNVYSSNCYSCDICYRESITDCTTNGVYHCYLCGCDVCPNCETNLQSCEAEGFYMQNQEKHPMRGNFVIYPSGTIKGYSADNVGRATWTGTYSNGDCLLTKHYIEKHSVKYSGSLSDCKIIGTWTLGDANGAFELMFNPTFFSHFSKLTLKSEEATVRMEEISRPEGQEESKIYLKESVRGGDANPTVGSNFDPLPNTTDKLDFICDAQKRRESFCGVDHYQNSIVLKSKPIITPNPRVSSCFLC